VDGVLLSSQGLSAKALAGLRTNVPVVLLGERTARTALDHVGIDNVKASREAVTHLIDTGRRRIAAIGDSAMPADRPADMTSKLRLKGYRAALSAAGLPLDDDLYVRTPTYARGDAAAAVQALLGRRDRPDGLFCFSDELAVGALRELHVQGVRVPTDISVVGFDNVDETRFSIPSLTSVSPDKAAIATVALDLLIERIAGSEVKPRDIRVPYELIIRESSSIPN
jgi:LacI family repressor for deo operon, udp, cdd, tsx, nupC, and nupG